MPTKQRKSMAMQRTMVGANIAGFVKVADAMLPRELSDINLPGGDMKQQKTEAHVNCKKD